MIWDAAEVHSTEPILNSQFTILNLSKMKIVFLDAYTSNPGDLSWDGLRQLGECVIYDRSTPEQIVPRSREADAILINKVLITREMMQQLPQLPDLLLLLQQCFIIHQSKS